jgi:hypothetical protein
MSPYRNANKEIDYENIDTFIFSDDKYHLCGDWGKIEIISEPPRIEIID